MFAKFQQRRSCAALVNSGHKQMRHSRDRHSTLGSSERGSAVWACAVHVKAATKRTAITGFPIKEKSKKRNY